MANSSAAGTSGVENTMWTWAEDKKFEIGLVEFPDGTPNRWEKIAASVGTKLVAEVEHHYAILLEDIEAIEAGLVELPPFNINMISEPASSRCGPIFSLCKHLPRVMSPMSLHVREGIEVIPRLFLQGLEIYGKGDWKSISRYVVQTRNPTQVASHAQKYFERHEREQQNKKRWSIFDSSIGESSSNTKLKDN
ncbi:hypothetical protein ACS0TY_034684 [Phlomoides rotata]